MSKGVRNILKVAQGSGAVPALAQRRHYGLVVAQIVAQARGVAKELLHGGQLAQISRQSLLQKRRLNLSPLPLGRTAHLQKQQRINSRAQQQNCRGSDNERSLSPA